MALQKGKKFQVIGCMCIAGGCISFVAALVGKQVLYCCIGSMGISLGVMYLSIAKKA
jgi:hypothetical protein